MFFLDFNIANHYKSASQKARVMTEPWALHNSYCPCCGNELEKYVNNKPVADFFCGNCKEDYELKSGKTESFSNIVPDGSYKTMIERLECSSNPNFFVLQYNKQYQILNYIAIPKFFIRTQDIIKRPRILKDRGPYLMCDISLKLVPDSGKIFYIKNGNSEHKKDVLKNWNKIIFLKEKKDIESKGWILDIMKCIESLNKKDFTLQEMYNFESLLRQKYPNNNFIKDKIRQQLQFLRNKGYLEFISSGKYKLI